MKIFTNLKLVALFALLAAVPFVAGVYTEHAAAQEGNQAQEQQAEEQDQEQQIDTTYEYTAQPGDSYTLIARKAVQTYGLVSQTNLSEAQIVYAETLLTQEAGSPQLNEGQKINIKESTVRGWVEKANGLTDEQKAAWEAYTVGVDFNTDNVGESR